MFDSGMTASILICWFCLVLLNSVLLKILCVWIFWYLNLETMELKFYEGWSETFVGTCIRQIFEKLNFSFIACFVSWLSFRK